MYEIPYLAPISWAIADKVQQEMEWVCSAHDFFHIARVVKLAQQLHKQEWSGEIAIIEAGALLHESLDDKFFAADELDQRKEGLNSMLQELWMDTSEREGVMFIVENVGYGKSLARGDDFVGTMEFKIVEDADRLEAVGAIAIARTFAYGGKKGRAIHDPSAEVNTDMTRESYKKAENTSINHFYEKLLLLKDMMHTQSGRKAAEERHAFMESYLQQFYQEWDADL